MNQQTSMEKESIAIVGIDCRYPGAHNAQEFWENILSLRQQFRRIPGKRLNLDHYGSNDPNAIDATYSKNAALLLGYHFDRVKYRISKSTYEQTDLAHWLALDVATGALKDAGFADGEGLNRERVGVIIGNSLNGEFTRANIMRLRWPYVSKVMHATLSSMSYHQAEIDKILTAAEDLYKQPFPAPNADTLAGGLSNTIAGRVCNYYDFKGGGYTVDGACSSSLLAIANACNAIINGEMDIALAGGVDLSIDAFETIGFARNGALAATEMEVFSGKPQGFWPGEGCGIVVLMKLSEALSKGHTIYGVVKGWGISSDGKGGMTRPKIETQQLAMERAYEKAGYDASTISVFEAHGTGTPLGDEVEITSISNTIRKYGRADGTPAVLGSVKQLIGHTKAAAGVAGFIKACLVLKHKVIPGALKTSPNPLLEKNKEYLVLPGKSQLYDKEQPLRAGVSSFGFGGINVHITLEECPSRRRVKKLPAVVKKLAQSRRDVEVFPVTESNAEAFVKVLTAIQRVSRNISRAEFTDLSVNLTNSVGKPGKYKASIVARTPDELYDRINALLEKVTAGADRFIQVQQGIFYTSMKEDAPNAFLFPGQGAPTYTDLNVFHSLNYEFSLPSLHATKNFLEETLDTSEAQPIIINNTLNALELLQFYGVEAAYSIGHSLGEIASLCWAGVIDAETAVELAATRGKMMSEYGEKGGAMLAVKCTEEEVHQLMQGLPVNITGYNGLNSYVVGGKMEAIDEVQRRAFDREFQTTKLKVSHAFHTPLMKESATQFKEAIGNVPFRKPGKEIISTVTGNALDASTNITQHLFEQIEQPVKFQQAIDQIRNKTNFLFEVGPGAALSKSLMSDDRLQVISIDFGNNSLQGFLQILSAAFISGNEINFQELSSGRHYNAFDLEQWTLDVLENPCEAIDHIYSVTRTNGNGISKEIISSNGAASHTVNGVNGSAHEQHGEAAAIAEAPPADSLEGVTLFIKKLIGEKMDMPVDFISGNDRIMSQLHINSLAIAEIVSLVTKAFKKSHKTFSAATVLASADGTIGEISQLIFEGESAAQQTAGSDGFSTEKLYNWTHIFKRHSIERPASKNTLDRKQGPLLVTGDPFWSQHLQQQMEKQDPHPGNAAIFVYESSKGTSYLARFVQFLQDAAVRAKNYIVLVNIHEGIVEGDLKPVFRSFHQEVPQIGAFAIDINKNIQNPGALLCQEFKTVSRYKEIYFDQDGRRTESECTVYFPGSNDINSVISDQDVILATGGGKGITYESVKELASLTNASLALIGRALPASDKELAANLEKLTADGIRFKYYSADVLNKESVQEAVLQIQQDLGPITVVLHGAGVNTPKRLESLTMADFRKTLSVKLEGLKHVVESLKAEQLKLLIGYGSVIAQSGMKGNADYAWANDQMALYIEQLGKQYTNGRFITLEWSVWDETGMGVALNSIEALKWDGIAPIPVKNGLQILRGIVADQADGNGRYIIMGRYGKSPTLVFTRRKPTTGRFISKIVHHVPNIEVVADVNIDLNSDVYLLHHVLDGQYIFPTVMILEGMAQIAQLVHGGTQQISFRDLTIDRAIFVPKEGARTIRFIATRISEYEIKLAVHSDETNFDNAFFAATVCFDGGNALNIAETLQEEMNAVHVDVPARFYDDLLFHTGPFRRIREFYQISALGSTALAINGNGEDKWFGSFLPEEKLLGDPGLNDAAIHCHQACRPSQTLLPVSAKGIIFNPAPVEGPLYIQTTELHEIGNDTTINVVVMNKKGEIKLLWQELVLRRITARGFKGEWDPVFLKPYLEYTLNHVAGHRETAVALDDCHKITGDLKSGADYASFETAGYLLQFEAATHQNGGSVPGQLKQETTLRLPGSDQPMKLKIIQLNPLTIQQD